MHRSASATSTNAVLSMARRTSASVSVMLGDVPAARHNARSASASSERHSRMKKLSVLSDGFISLEQERKMATSERSRYFCLGVS